GRIEAEDGGRFVDAPKRPLEPVELVRHGTLDQKCVNFDGSAHCTPRNGDEVGASFPSPAGPKRVLKPPPPRPTFLLSDSEPDGLPLRRAHGHRRPPAARRRATRVAPPRSRGRTPRPPDRRRS